MKYSFDKLVVWQDSREKLNLTIAFLDLKYINENQYIEIRNQIEKVSNKLSALTK